MDDIMAGDERPIVFWSERDKEVVQEQDLINNFDLLKTYLWVVGHTTPLPHLLHHEAAMILLSVTFNMHAGVYNVRGGRGLIRDWAKGQALRLRCMGTHLMSITRGCASCVHLEAQQLEEACDDLIDADQQLEEEKTGKVAEKFNKKQEKLQAKAMDNATKEKSSARKGRVTKGSEGDKVEKRPRGRPRKGTTEVETKPAKRKAKVVTPVKAKKPRRDWKPSPMALKVQNQASDARMDRARAALEELVSAMKAGDNGFVIGFEAPEKNFKRKSYTINVDPSWPKDVDSKVASIGVVLYSRSFYCNRAIGTPWPKLAVQRGLQVDRKSGCTVPWGDDIQSSWLLSMEIAGWPLNQERGKGRCCQHHVI
ncbi:unnamed protein product [Cladocopium goreaui]|uniref:Uncharacterized protein n=1 Tax=Cladocopium goreaui TaxID=2562237 RepID=A0A9P1CZU0_9DINO|nr:unnamed protein product [Cladocopium goreaui]